MFWIDYNIKISCFFVVNGLQGLKTTASNPHIKAPLFLKEGCPAVGGTGRLSYKTCMLKYIYINFVHQSLGI